MDEYYRLAHSYFQQFEPRTAFPGLKSPHWYLCLLALLSFGYFGYQHFIADVPAAEKSYGKLLASEVVFLIICIWIALYRFKHIVQTTSEASNLRPAERLILAKRAALENLFHRPSWQFTEVVEEIAQLRKLEASYQSFVDQSTAELLGKLFSPKVLATLLTLLGSLLVWTINWASKSEGLALSDILASPSKLNLLVALSKLLAVTVFAMVASYVVLWQIFNYVPLLISSVVPVLRSDPVILNYLIRDLIQCRTMAPRSILPQAPTPQSPTTLYAMHHPVPPMAPSSDQASLANHPPSIPSSSMV